MSFTIFYSWQSDNDQKVTRYFIKDALEKAIKVVGREVDLDEPIRLDQDTQGVPGSPEIANTIFNKIESCGIFVADLSFIAVSPTGKNIPNPNVLIELGYAYKAVSGSRIVKVMNESFGKASDGLPFDLAHRRWPIRYSLPPASPAEEAKRIKDDLISAFVIAIKAILETGTLQVDEEKEFEETPPRWQSSSFLSDGELLTKLIPFGDLSESTDIFWTNGPQAFLRIIPSKPMKELSSIEHFEIVKTKIGPLGRTGGAWTMRNKSGTVVFDAGSRTGDNEIRRFTQIFKNGEIWGVDKFRNISEGNYIATGYIEEIFTNCLHSYLNFARTNLDLAPPLKIIAGLSGVEGCCLALPQQFFDKYGGHCYDDEIIYHTVINSYDIDVTGFLGRFFDKIWESCGMKRPEPKK